MRSSPASFRIRSGRSSTRGFSLLELMVVASLCAVVFTSGSLALRAVAQNQRRATAYQEVPLPDGVAANFFPGATGSTIDCYTAPNYGRATLANQMRNLFHEDAAGAVAIFPLPRAGNLNTIRENIIPLGSGVLPSSIDTPARFLEILKATSATSSRAAVFQTYRGAPADSITDGVETRHITNGTVFILQPSGAATELWIRAVYEIDYIGYRDTSNTTSEYPYGMPCIYACVRRYVNETLTNFYDVVHTRANQTSGAQTGKVSLSEVGVPFVHFEKAVRRNVTEAAVTAWKAAGNQPFFMMWWPDPGVSRLYQAPLVLTSGESIYKGTLQEAYAKHDGQTAFTFIFPQFPPY